MAPHLRPQASSSGPARAASSLPVTTAPMAPVVPPAPQLNQTPAPSLQRADSPAPVSGRPRRRTYSRALWVTLAILVTGLMLIYRGTRAFFASADVSGMLLYGSDPIDESALVTVVGGVALLVPALIVGIVAIKRSSKSLIPALVIAAIILLPFPVGKAGVASGLESLEQQVSAMAPQLHTQLLAAAGNPEALAEVEAQGWAPLNESQVRHVDSLLKDLQELGVHVPYADEMRATLQNMSTAEATE